jgi:uncharacterized membrane protein
MESNCKNVNVGEMERIASGVAGGLPLALGVRNGRSAIGMGLLALAGGLLYRATSGNCVLYRALGIDSASVKACPPEATDISSEDSFPASDPPAWTSASASRSSAVELVG